MSVWNCDRRRAVLSIPLVIYEWIWSTSLMVLAGKSKKFGGTCRSTTLSTNPTWTVLAANTSLLREKPGTKRLSCGTICAVWLRVNKKVVFYVVNYFLALTVNDVLIIQGFHWTRKSSFPHPDKITQEILACFHKCTYVFIVRSIISEKRRSFSEGYGGVSGAETDGVRRFPRLRKCSCRSCSC